MDYHAIYKKAFSAVREAYPCSDHETAFENVVRRAGESPDTQCRLPMPFTDGGNEKMNNDKNVRRLNARDLPAPETQEKRRSRAPMIGGIAAGVAAALGVGFFAGNAAGSGITITPLKEGGAGYHAETTVPEPPEAVTEPDVQELPGSATAVSEEPETTEDTGLQYFFQSYAHDEQINAPAPTVHYSTDENESGIAPDILPSGEMPVAYDFGNVKVLPGYFGFDGMRVVGYFDLVWEDGIPADQYAFTGDNFLPEVWLGVAEEPSATAVTKNEGAQYFLDADGKTMHCTMTVTLASLHESIDLRFIHETKEYLPDEERWTKPITLTKAETVPGVRFTSETQIPLISGRSTRLYEIDISPSTVSFCYASANDSYWDGFDVDVILQDGTEIALERDTSGGAYSDGRVYMLYHLYPQFPDDHYTLGDIAAFRFRDTTDPDRDTVVQLYTSDIPAVTSSAAPEAIPEATYTSDEIIR